MKGLSKPGSQPSEINWSGGYWNVLSSELTGEEITEPTKRGWRQEYLPAATEVLAIGFAVLLAPGVGSARTRGLDAVTADMTSGVAGCIKRH